LAAGARSQPSNERGLADALGHGFRASFAEALDEAVDTATNELTRSCPHLTEETAAVLKFVLTEEPAAEQAQHVPVLIDLPDGRLSSAIADALSARLKSLGDQDLTEVGSSSAELLGFDPSEAATLLADVLTAVICRRAALGTQALAPLANQLNFELEARSAIIASKLAVRLDRHRLGGERWINPEQRYRALAVDRFVGRQWLVDELDSFVASQDSGYFVLEAAAGLGKSTFLAWIARKRGYAQHFVRLADGRDDTAAALNNLSAQLASAWSVEGPPSLVGRDVQPHEFYDLLCEVARERRRRRAEPVVVVIDGLDEVASPPARGNVLGLPEALPDGVFFVVSQRPVQVSLSVERDRLLTLSNSDERNLADLREYLLIAAHRPAVAAALQHADVAAVEFVELLVERSAGVWLYVRYVLDEIENGTGDLLDLDALPGGLWEYYAEQVRRRRDSDGERWERYDLPVLTTLAAAQEPLPRATLAALSSVTDGGTLDDVIDDWSAFLEQEGSPPYRLYHDSMRAFLSGEAARDLRAGQRRSAQRFAREVCRAHGRIIDQHLKHWGGLNNGLPGLRDPERARVNDGYGVRHLVAHLQYAGRRQQLRELLLAEWPSKPRPLNAWYETHAQAGDHARYLTDLARARRVAEIATDQALAADEMAVTAGDEFGYALLAGSIHSQTRNIPSRLRVALVRHGNWTLARALADIQQLADPKRRADASTNLAEGLSGKEREQVIGVALGAAYDIGNEFVRARVLNGLVGHLSADQLTTALIAARDIGNEFVRARVLNGLVGHLSADQLSTALIAARDIDNAFMRAEVLSRLAGHLSTDQREHVVDEVLAAAQQVGEDTMRPHVLGLLAEPIGEYRSGEAVERELAGARLFVESGGLSHVDSLSGDRLDVPLAVSCEFESMFVRARVLARLAEHLDPDPGERVAEEALAAVRQINNELVRAHLLSRLAWRLNDTQLDVALAAACQIRDQSLGAQVLDRLAEYLNGNQLDVALVAARQIGDQSLRAELLGKLARLLSADRREQAIGEALEAAHQIDNDGVRAHLLITWIEYLSADQRQQAIREALAVASVIRGEYARVSLLSRLLKHLDTDQLDVALVAARQISDESQRADILGELAERLNGNQLDVALAAVRQISDESRRAYRLGKLAEYLNGIQLDVALVAARQIGDQSVRAELLGKLARRVSADRREQAIGEALEAAHQIGDESVRASLLMTWVEWLSADQREQVIGRALEAAHETDNRPIRAGRLGAWVEHVRADELDLVLAAICRLDDDLVRARLLVALVRHLGVDHREQMAGEALAAADKIADDVARASLVEGLAEHLSANQLDVALAVARRIGDEPVRTDVLEMLVDRLSAEQLEHVEDEAVAAAHEIDDDSARAHLLEMLAEGRGASEPDQAASPSVRTMVEAGIRPMATLGEHLDVRDLEMVLVSINDIRDERARGHLLNALHDGLGRYQWMAFAAADETGDDSGLLDVLAQGLDADEFKGAMAALPEIRSEFARAHLLGALVKRLSADQLEQALVAVSEMSNEFARVHLLDALLERLSTEQLDHALRQALTLSTPQNRADALDRLLPRQNITGESPVRGWRDLLTEAATLGRPHVVRVAVPLLPVIAHLGGPPAVKMMFAWLRATARWWP
jgi:hypothetical protein